MPNREIGGRFDDVAEVEDPASIRSVIVNGLLLAKPPTQTEIAARVATHREAVARDFNLLDREGMIERHAGKLIIRDVERLANVVDKGLGA